MGVGALQEEPVRKGVKQDQEPTSAKQEWIPGNLGLVLIHRGRALEPRA